MGVAAEGEWRGWGAGDGRCVQVPPPNEYKVRSKKGDVTSYGNRLWLCVCLGDVEGGIVSFFSSREIG